MYIHHIGIVTYDVDDSINVTAAEVVALANYRSDRDLFTPNPDLACTDQQPNVAICANCLSERRAYWCYASFPKCVSDVANKQSICRHVCERNNIKCGTSEDCSLLSDSDCAAGFFTGYLSRSLHIYGLGVFTIRLDMALATILSLCLCYFDLFEV